MNIIRSVDDIIKRVLVLQILVDRGWAEFYTKKKLDLQKIKKQHVEINNWVEQENCINWMTDHEKTIYEKQLNTLTKSEIKETTVLLEAMVPLLMCLNIYEDINSYLELVKDKYYAEIFFKNKNPIYKIKRIRKLNDGLNIDPSILEQQFNAYLILFWRILIRLKSKRVIDVKKVFDIPSFHDIINQLPFHRNSDIYVKMFDSPINRLNKKDVKLLYNIVFNRLRSLYWLTSPIEWDDIHSKIFDDFIKTFR